MTSDLGIWRDAKLLVEQHGHEAEIQTAVRADELLEAGDMEGSNIWCRILVAIVELRRGRREDEGLN
jgi:hypothetical protein